jgi:hypothetical protein
MADGTVGVLQSPGADRLIDNEVLTVGGQTVYRQRIALGATTGTWSYYAGVSGTVTVTAGQRILGIAAHSTAGGSMTINGGSSIPIPAGSGIAISPAGNLVAPVLVFTSTDSYFVEVVS